MRIAAIDIGSNSFHMVIVESRSGGFHVIDREKEMVRLGERTLSRGRLSAASMRRGLDALREYKRLADMHGVDKLLVVATSAVREAANGEDFLERVGGEIGFYPQVVSGEEEARLIYLAALHSVNLEGRRTLVVDIGGGSVELAMGVGPQVEWAVSEKLGVLRMTERFVHSDPLAARDERRLVGYVRQFMVPHAARARDDGFDLVVGTSGTALALGAMATAAGILPESLHHLTVPAAALHALRRRLVGTTLKGRRRLPLMDERRTDIIVAGAVVLDEILDALEAKEIVLCEWALREGLLLDYLTGHKRAVARAEAYPDVRRRSVVALAERCHFHEAHARQVAALALGLFDATASRHGLQAPERSLLEYAALLHDIGHAIDHDRHQHHSCYLVRNAELLGFERLEIELIAQAVRGHRKQMPKLGDPGLRGLPGSVRRAVRGLAALLRIADALDRTHFGVVRSVGASLSPGRLLIAVEAGADNPELELWAAERRADLLSRLLDRPVVLRWRRGTAVRPSLRASAS